MGRRGGRRKGSKAAAVQQARQGACTMDDNAEDCPVCLTTFDDTLRRPRTLPCGHTFCTPCIDGLKDQGQATCPTCRSTHAVPEAGQFPVSYAVEALIRRLRGAALACPPPRPGKATGEPAPSPPGPGQEEGPAGLSRPIRSMLEEQEARVLAAIHACQEVQAQLHQYQATLEGWGQRQQTLEDRLQALLDQSKGARVLVRQEESRVKDKREQVQQGEQQLHALLQELRTVNTRQEAWKTIDEAEHHTDTERQRVEECQGMFPDLHTATTMSKVTTVSSAAVEAARNIHEALETVGVAGDLDLPAAQDLSIRDKFEAVQAPTMKVEDLRSLTQLTRTMLQAGLVFAVHQVEGRKKHARITLEDDDSLYLHSLQHQPLPPFSIRVQVAEVVPPSPPCLVFLDLQWPGTAPRRVLIRLDPDSPMSRQFVLMCTGQRGPCYANTKLFCVMDKGKPGERVLGGDYEKNDGTGGAALLPDFDKSEFRQSGKAGTVVRLIRGGNKSDWNALFGIITRDREKGMVYVDVFGEVEAGLDAVAAAAQHSNIKEVTVVDCGVVL